MCKLSLPDETEIDECRAQAQALTEGLRRAAQLVGAGASAEAEEILVHVRREAGALARQTKEWVQLVDGETVEFYPGVPDKRIHTVPRIRAVVDYVRERVRPALAAHAVADPIVLVEFQMVPNYPARYVAAALVAEFAGDRVYLVAPSLKNTVSVCAAAQYALFAEKYASSYTANKAHAACNFGHIERLFGSGVAASSAAKRGHVADSFMQVLGFIRAGSPADHSF